VRQRNSLLSEIRELATGERDRQRAIDLLNYQIDEIAKANLQLDEDTQLMAEKMRLANAEKLHSAASEVYGILYENADGRSAMDLLSTAINSLSGVIRFDPSLQSALDNLESATVQVQDVCHEIGDYCESIQFDPEKLAEIDDRLVMINNLRRKYGSTVEDILVFYDEKIAELDKITHHEERINDTQKRLAKLEIKVVDTALALSEKRLAISHILSRDIEAELAELGMPHAKFVINISRDINDDGIEIDGEKVAVRKNGIDKVAFMISANIGEAPRPLAKIASGGEISRIMLALKSIAHRGTGVPTLIFDEVDSGIGGRTAEVVGMKLMKAARAAQIICVTHLAQIALYGDRHFSIEKMVVSERTVSTMRAMNEEERVHELARLQAGGRISDAVITHIRGAMRDIAEQKATV
jgi:DNA repair protein RecN (Recombination protein N)